MLAACYTWGMSYRGVKRVLVGETSLERKCRWWFGIALGVLLVLTFLWSGQELRDMVRDNDKKLGPKLVALACVETHFEDLMQPTADEREGLLPSEELAWREIVAGIAAMGRDIGSQYEQGEFEYDSYALYPQDPTFNPDGQGRPTYDYEWELLKRYEQSGPEAEPTNRYDEDKTIWRYYQPLYAKEQCLICHAHMPNLKRPGLAEDELIAVMRIEMDRTAAKTDFAMYEGTMWGVAVVIGCLSMLLLWAIVRLLIVKPVKHLRDVANAVREGATDQRASIETGDEFEELAASFNRMLRQLLSQQTSLESVNAELDGKVDELAQMNLRLFEMNRLKSDFLATMSHELRTPLNSILGFSEVLCSVDSLDAKQQRYVGNIQRSGKMLLEMINDILDLAKLESGRMDPSPSEFPLSAIVTAQCDMARPLAERKNIDLVATLPKDAPPLRQDQAKLQQVINNLLSNAIKFTPEGGRIQVRAKREADPADRSADDVLVLEVEDTGIGINEEDQAIIFEKFRQGASAAPEGNAMTREQGGTGLGLSIVREMCRLLGGDVAVRSVAGKGSTFIVRLPWRLPDRTNLDAELERGVAELTRTPGSGSLPPLPAPTATPAAEPATN
ncbi:MAG: ATP-binding protein [Planctomycetota bacterium]